MMFETTKSIYRDYMQYRDNLRLWSIPSIIWYILNVRFLFTYRNTRIQPYLYPIQNTIYRTPAYIKYYSMKIILFFPRLVLRPFGWLLFQITKPIRDKHDSGDYELEQVQIRYPNASMVQCVSCDYEIGFYLNESGHTGWRYAYLSDWNIKTLRLSWFKYKINQLLVKVGIRWELMEYMSLEGDLGNCRDTIDCEMEYVSGESDYTFSMDGTEGDLCGGCANDIFGRGTRFKVYQSGERLEFRYNGALATQWDCSDLSQYWDEITKHLGYYEEPKSKPEDYTPPKELIHLVDVSQGEDKRKKALVDLADTQDIPLFSDGCCTNSLYCLEEDKKQFITILEAL